jgi:hypothetical protein
MWSAQLNLLDHGAMIFQADAHVSALGLPGLQPTIGQEFVESTGGMCVYSPHHIYRWLRTI